MRTTGETKKGTTGAAAEEILAPQDGTETHILIDNFDGPFSGFFSIKGSTGPFIHLPKGAIIALDDVTIHNVGVFIKRIGGDDLDEIFAVVW